MKEDDVFDDDSVSHPHTHLSSMLSHPNLVGIDTMASVPVLAAIAELRLPDLLKAAVGQLLYIDVSTCRFAVGPLMPFNIYAATCIKNGTPITYIGGVMGVEKKPPLVHLFEFDDAARSSLTTTFVPANQAQLDALVLHGRGAFNFNCKLIDHSVIIDGQIVDYGHSFMADGLQTAQTNNEQLIYIALLSSHRSMIGALPIPVDGPPIAPSPSRRRGRGAGRGGGRKRSGGGRDSGVTVPAAGGGYEGKFFYIYNGNRVLLTAAEFSALDDRGADIAMDENQVDPNAPKPQEEEKKEINIDKIGKPDDDDELTKQSFVSQILDSSISDAEKEKMITSKYAKVRMLNDAKQNRMKVQESFVPKIEITVEDTDKSLASVFEQLTTTAKDDSAAIDELIDKMERVATTAPAIVDDIQPQAVDQSAEFGTADLAARRNTSKVLGEIYKVYKAMSKVKQIRHPGLMDLRVKQDWKFFGLIMFYQNEEAMSDESDPTRTYPLLPFIYIPSKPDGNCEIRSGDMAANPDIMFQYARDTLKGISMNSAQQELESSRVKDMRAR